MEQFRQIPQGTLTPLPQDIANLPPADGIDPIGEQDIHEAYKGVNSLDNVEVVDMEPVSGLEAGVWKVIIKGTSVPGGDFIQDFSLVSDYKLEKQ